MDALAGRRAGGGSVIAMTEEQPIIVCGQDDPRIIVGAGDSASTVRTIAALKAGKADRVTPAGFRRAGTWLRSTGATTVDGRRVARLIQVVCQSQGIGNGAFRNRHPVSRYPANAFMLALADAGNRPLADAYQSAHLASNPLLDPPALIPLHEQVGRTNPDYVDPVGGAVTPFASNTGNTFVTAMVEAALDAEAFEGVLPADLSLYVVANCGIGGHRLSHLGRGTYAAKRRREARAAFRAICDREGWVPEVHTLIWQGTAEVAQNELEEVSDQLTPENRAATVLQFRQQEADDIAREGFTATPLTFMIQAGPTYPSASPAVPVLNGRRGTISDGDRLACAAHPDLRMVAVDYVGPRSDGVHVTAEGEDMIGAAAGHAIGRTLTGIGDGGLVEMIGSPRMTAPDTVLAVYDTRGLPLRRLGWEVTRFTVLDGGFGNDPGQIVAVPAMDYAQALVRIDTVDGAGRMLTGTILDNGSASTDPSGPQPTINVLAGIRVDAPGALYQQGAIVPLVGGEADRPGKVRLTTDGAGHILAVTVVDPGIYTTPLSGQFTVRGGGVGAGGALLSFQSAGTPPVLAVGSLSQIGQDWGHGSILGSLVLSGTVTPVGTTLPMVGADIAADGYSPTAVVAGTDLGTGAANYIRIACGGPLNTAPGETVTFSNGTDSVVARVARGAFPLLDPGDGGINLTDDSYPGGNQDANLVAFPPLAAMTPKDEAGILGSAMAYRFAGAVGPNPVLHVGQYAQSLEGPSCGARACVGTAPIPGAPAGPYGLLPRLHLPRGSYRFVNPYRAAPAPILDNASFAIAADGDLVALGNTGAYAADRWRGYRNTGGGFVARVAGARQARALRIGRNDGTTAAAAIGLAHVVDGEAARRLRGKPVTFTADFSRGGGWSPPGGTVIVRIYTNTSAAAAFGTASLPAGSVQLVTDSVVPGTTPATVSFSTGAATIPADAELVIVYLQAAGFTGTAAADWFQIEAPRLCPGTQPCDYVELAETEERERCERHYRRLAGFVPAGPGLVASFDPPLARTPVVTGGGPGFTVDFASADLLWAHQASAGATTLTIDARQQ